MNELLRKRIERHLENLTDQQGYQLLDFVEFLESKYGTASRPATTFERLTEGVEDALRAGRLPAAAIRETMGAVDTASRMMQRLAEAGRAAVDELGRSLAETEQAGTEPSATDSSVTSEPGANASPAAGEPPPSRAPEDPDLPA